MRRTKEEKQKIVELITQKILSDQPKKLKLGWVIESFGIDQKQICTKCKTINEYAEPNQPDGTYICYGCR